MKKLSALFAIAFATLTTQAQATTVTGISGLTLLSAGDSVSGTSNLYDFTSSTAADTISQSAIHSHLTDNSYGTYLFAADPVAYVDIAFTTNTIYNGAGNDLAFFFAGAIDFNQNVIIDFDLSINGITNNYTPVLNPGNVDNSELIITDAFGSYTLTVAMIDLDDFGLGFASTTALQDFRVLLGSNNSTNRPALSMIGGFHTTATQTTVIPLPLPVILFTSGLGVLGLFARRKKASLTE